MTHNCLPHQAFAAFAATEAEGSGGIATEAKRFDCHRLPLIATDYYDCIATEAKRFATTDCH
jgi:hypothetical protein